MYKFTNLDLTEEEFFNLHFMNPPTREEDKFDNEFIESLCSQPLKHVAKKVIEESCYKGNNPTEIFRGIDAKPKMMQFLGLSVMHSSANTFIRS